MKNFDKPLALNEITTILLGTHHGLTEYFGYDTDEMLLFLNIEPGSNWRDYPKYLDRCKELNEIMNSPLYQALREE